jgi:hypothetical protein
LKKRSQIRITVDFNDHYVALIIITDGLELSVSSNSGCTKKDHNCRRPGQQQAYRRELGGVRVKVTSGEGRSRRTAASRPSSKPLQGRETILKKKRLSFFICS